ncbi:MAG: hypothetical protein NPIRA02_18780 [Nitrospirales bacterium]|nr:MAG: hypothetical protein NPIRA02_18780 [Nitrospirales bacterium]
MIKRKKAVRYIQKGGDRTGAGPYPADFGMPAIQSLIIVVSKEVFSCSYPDGNF